MTPEAFATHWHGDQVRKYTGEPYIEHDPKFAKVYLAEARIVLDVLVKGDASLRERLRLLIA